MTVPTTTIGEQQWVKTTLAPLRASSKGEDAKFTFVGSKKPIALPDTPVELANTGESSDS